MLAVPGVGGGLSFALLGVAVFLLVGGGAGRGLHVRRGGDGDGVTLLLGGALLLRHTLFGLGPSATPELGNLWRGHGNEDASENLSAAAICRDSKLGTNAHLRKVALGGGIDAVTLGELVHHCEEGVQVRRRVGGRPRLLLLLEGPSGYLLKSWSAQV